MNDLLEFAIEAHGGWRAWNQYQRMTAEASIGGAIWALKNVRDILQDKTFELHTHEEYISIRPFGPDAVDTRFDGRTLRFESNGIQVASYDAPAKAFDGQALDTPWQPMHAAYFASEAMWTYLASPFLYAYDGFKVREIEPWREDGEQWRRLEVIFPDHIASHTRTQVTHFGPDGLMRRHDYTVDILGGTTGANYPSEYRRFQGIMMPTRRRIFAYDADRQKVREPLLVSIDISSIQFA